MKIFLISIDTWWGDCYSEFVIAANSEEDVRGIAKQNAAKEGEGAWDSAYVKEIGEYTGESEDPTLILGSFHAR